MAKKKRTKAPAVDRGGKSKRASKPKTRKVDDPAARVLASISAGKHAARVGMAAEIGFRGEPEWWAETGIEALDRYALGTGGLPSARISEVYGMPGCLDADTFVLYDVRSPDGRKQNGKGGTIERLYERFHRIPRGGKGYYQRTVTVGSEFFAQSINEDGCVFRNRIVDVVKTGRKPCLAITTEEGRIIVSYDHKFWTGERFVRAEDLRAGSIVHVHNNTFYPRASDADGDRPSRVYLYVKHHPTAGIKVVRDVKYGYEYEYRRIPRARAVIEASMNGVTLEDYVARLNRGDVGGLKVLPRDLHVHHIDEDHTNDAFDNLMVMDPVEHSRLHSLDRHTHIRYVSVPTEVTEIEPVGDRYTYDLRMESPFNNYVANRFVVHNSGKSSLAYSYLGRAQRAGGVALLVHSEEAAQLARLPTFGVDPSKLILIEGDEHGLPTAEAMDAIRRTCEAVAAMNPRPRLAIAWDSLAMSGTADEKVTALDFDRRPAVLSKGWRIVAPLLAAAQGHLMVVNQVRDKIGALYGPKTTTPGGHGTKHASTVRLDMQYVGRVKQGDRVVGVKIQVYVAKNKVADPFRRVTTRLIFARGWDDGWTTLDVAKDWGLVPKRSVDVEAARSRLRDVGWDPARAAAAVRGRVVELDHDPETGEVSEDRA